MSFEMEKITTLTGYTLPQLAAVLDEELPPGAYTPISGTADLTDIDPAWQRRVYNQVFGLCGLGWGFEYDPHDISMSQEKRPGPRGEHPVWVSLIRKFTFWFKVLVDGQVERCEIPGSGGSENESPWYALKGAITNALGATGSFIQWQEAVYMGLRSHLTVGKPPAADEDGSIILEPAAAPPAAEAVPAVPALPEAPAPAKRHIWALASPDGAFARTDLMRSEEPFSCVCPIGRKMGKKLGELNPAYITWVASQAVAVTPEQASFKQAAAACLEILVAENPAEFALAD